MYRNTFESTAEAKVAICISQISSYKGGVLVVGKKQNKLIYS